MQPQLELALPENARRPLQLLETLEVPKIDLSSIKFLSIPLEFSRVLPEVEDLYLAAALVVGAFVDVILVHLLPRWLSYAQSDLPNWQALEISVL